MSIVPQHEINCLWDGLGDFLQMFRLLRWANPVVEHFTGTNRWSGRRGRTLATGSRSCTALLLLFLHFASLIDQLIVEPWIGPTCMLLEFECCRAQWIGGIVQCKWVHVRIERSRLAVVIIANCESRLSLALLLLWLWFEIKDERIWKLHFELMAGSSISVIGTICGSWF